MANLIHALPAAISIFLLSSHVAADYVLYTGEVLLAGQNLTNGRYDLSMQPNCELVLYDNNYPTWRASTSGDSDNTCYLTLKHNGELVVRRNVHYTFWSSASKSKKGKYALVLNGKGKLGVYGFRRWISNNNKERGHQSRSVVATKYVLHSDQKLYAGNNLAYRDYELGLANCNMVIKDTSLDRVLWQTSTEANSCFLEMESDGELTLKHGSHSLWSSQKKAESGKYITVLRFDGRLAVYGPLVWSNGRINDDDDDEESGGLELKGTLVRNYTMMYEL